MQWSQASLLTVPVVQKKGPPPTDNPYTITEEDLLHKQAKGNRGRFITQLYAGAVASLGALCLGLVIGWSTPIIYDMLVKELPWLETYFEQNHYSWVCSIVALGCAVGTIPSYLLLQKNVGPRKYMLVAGAIVICNWIHLAYLTTYNAFMITRFIAGGAAVSLFTCGQIFLRDCVTRYYLRYMLMTFRSSLPIGIAIIFVLAGVLDRKIICAICCSFSVLHMFLLFFAHDSPVILYDINPVEGEKALAWYWGAANIQLQLKLLQRDRETRALSASDPNTKYMLASKVVIKGALMVAGLTFFQVFTGYYCLLFYNVFIYKKQQSKRDISTVYAIIFAIFVGIFSCIGNFVHYNVPFGVKKPLIASSIMMTLTFSLLCVFIAWGEPGVIHDPYLAPLAHFTMFVFSYEIGLSYYPDVILMDCMPIQVYGKVKFLLNCMHWITVFIMVEYFLVLRRVVGFFYLFLFFTLMCFTCIFYCIFFVIETSGKSLYEIQYDLGGNPVGTRGYARRIHFTVM